MNLPLTPEERAEIIRRRIAGESPRALAREFGVGPGTVAGIVYRSGLTTPNETQGWRARIAPQVRALIVKHAERTSQSAAARAWGVSQQSVSAWMRLASRSPAPRSEVGAGS